MYLNFCRCLNCLFIHYVNIVISPLSFGREYVAGSGSPFSAPRKFDGEGDLRNFLVVFDRHEIPKTTKIQYIYDLRKGKTKTRKFNTSSPKNRTCLYEQQTIDVRNDNCAWLSDVAKKTRGEQATQSTNNNSNEFWFIKKLCSQEIPTDRRTNSSQNCQIKTG